MKKFYKPYKLKNRYHDGEGEKDADFEEIGQENIDRTMQSLQERCQVLGERENLICIKAGETQTHFNEYHDFINKNFDKIFDFLNKIKQKHQQNV